MNAENLTAASHIAAVNCLYIAVAMLIPAGLDYHDGDPGWTGFTLSSALVATPAMLLALATQKPFRGFSPRLGFLAVNALWLSASFSAAVPIYFSPAGLDFAGSLFEAVSGITTTGSTVLTGLDELPRGLLLWRSLIQWIGGIGIIGTGLLLLPYLRIGGMQLFRLESSDRSDKPVPRFITFARGIVWLYLVLSMLCAIGYKLAGMSWFDAINHAMTTISTGGFSTHDASMGYFGYPVLAVGGLFMMLGAMPFAAMLKAVLLRKYRVLDPQIPVLIAIVAVATALVTADLVEWENSGFTDAVILSSFNIISIITTTGYAANDYTLWGPFAITLVFLVTFFGGCAGSTAGGIKTYRLMIMWKTMHASIGNLIYPNGIFPVTFGTRKIKPEVMRSVTVFMVAFFAMLLLLTLLVSATGVDFDTAFTGVLTALTNVGPGLGPIIGPAGNFSTLPDSAKWLLSFAMLIGRLEIMTVLVLFSPVFWSDL